MIPADIPPSIPWEYISYGYTREESVPFPAYPSGGKDQDKSIYKYPTQENNNPLLIIEEDIMGNDGRGLKKGFYSTCPDENNDFLLLFQSGKLKAKIPIVSVEQRLKNPPVKDKKKPKKKKKNYKGTDSEDFVHQSAEIRFWQEKSCYIIIWERANTRIRAVIKLI